jgi:CRP-like cAMP-binding protein
MSTNQASALPERNRLLAALSAAEYQELLPDLEPVDLGLHEVLWAPEVPLTAVYFPRTGMISLLVIMDDGASIEVAAVGNEGIVGLPLFLGATVGGTQAVVQLPGGAARMGAQAFLAAAVDSSRLRHLLLRYTQARFDQVVQTAACNRHHSTDERCARWLLMIQDRVLAHTFPLTHEFLASMLDVRRATITEVASDFQRSGLIRYARGQITVLDRPGLEAVACECYRIVRQTYDRLLP